MLTNQMNTTQSSNQTSKTKTELLFDIESTGLLREGSQIHCIVARDLSDPETPLVFDHRPDRELLVGVYQIMQADVLIGHNILDYDLPLLKERYPDLDPQGEKLDTLVLSRLFYPHIKERDFDRRPDGMPLKLYVRHSLEAWGYRLKCFKGDYGKGVNAWDKYTPEMLDYCKQDTYVTYQLYRHFKSTKLKNA